MSVTIPDPKRSANRTPTRRLPVWAIVVAAALIATSAQAQNYPWCANFADGAGTNCGFPTLEQCMITVQGSGGYCDRNTQFKPSAAAAAPRKAHKSAHPS